MVDAKSPIQSLTVGSAAASAIISGAGAVGLEIGSSEANFIISALLALVAIYGRFRANKRIA